jgi:Fe-S-cluster containining protein
MCAADAGFLTGLERILLQADRAAREHRFECRQCGNCCRFEQFGHRLYVTAGELALMLHLAPDRVSEPIGKIRPWGIFDNPQSAIRNGSRAKPASLCPHQDQARCLARAGRALGCRLFFCAPSAHAWFCDAYESFHQQIKLLHAAHGLPYVYAELAAALAELASVAG